MPEPKVKKSPPVKKRHTKPCRYFQLSNCPKSGEECDFAHVIAPTPVTQSPKACKYFLAGSCTNGLWCRFVHPANRVEELRLDTAKLVDVSEGDVRYPYKHLLDGNTSLNFPFYASPPISPYQGVHSTEPLISPPLWSLPCPHTDIRVSSYHQLCVSPPATGLSRDTENRNGTEYSNPIVINSTSPTSPLQPGSPNAWSSKYKTKMCKFFTTGRQCPAGEACTFIHKSDQLSGHRSGDIRHQLPSKPLSAKDESMNKGYFPVSWRVIGGGVRIGSATNISLAYEDDIDSDNLSATDDDEFHYIETLQPQPVSLPTKLEFASLIKESDRELELGNSNAVVQFQSEEDNRKPPPPRTRANSIPNTPTVTHLQTRFSAES